MLKSCFKLRSNMMCMCVGSTCSFSVFCDVQVFHGLKSVGRV